MYNENAGRLVYDSQLIHKAHWAEFNSELRVHVTLWCPVYYRQTVLLFRRDFNRQFFISILSRLQANN